VIQPGFPRRSAFPMPPEGSAPPPPLPCVRPSADHDVANFRPLKEIFAPFSFQKGLPLFTLPSFVCVAGSAFWGLLLYRCHSPSDPSFSFFFPWPQGPRLVPQLFFAPPPSRSSETTANPPQTSQRVKITPGLLAVLDSYTGDLPHLLPRFLQSTCLPHPPRRCSGCLHRTRPSDMTHIIPSPSRLSPFPLACQVHHPFSFFAPPRRDVNKKTSAPPPPQKAYLQFFCSLWPNNR